MSFKVNQLVNTIGLCFCKNRKNPERIKQTIFEYKINFDLPVVFSSLRRAAPNTLEKSCKQIVNKYIFNVSLLVQSDTKERLTCCESIVISHLRETKPQNKACSARIRGLRHDMGILQSLSIALMHV